MQFIVKNNHFDTKKANNLEIENNTTKWYFNIRSRSINFDLAHMGISPIKMVRQNSNLQHKRINKSLPVKMQLNCQKMEWEAAQD